MNDHSINPIRCSIDECLSGFANRPSLRNRVLEQVKNEGTQASTAHVMHKDTTTGRKISFAMVLVITLLLVAMTALAVVLLKGQGFVQQILVPMATESETDKFSREELDIIIQLADENGIVLPEYWQTELNEVEGEFKDEVLRAFVESEFGLYSGAWPMEVQYWFEDVEISIGFYDDKGNIRLPEEGENTQEEITQKVEEYIITHFGADPEVLNAPFYVKNMVFYLPLDEVDPSKRIWDVTYRSMDIWHDSYTMVVSPLGVITEALEMCGYDDDGALPDDVKMSYHAMYGRMINWDSSARASYIEDIQKTMTMHPEASERANELIAEILTIEK